MHDKRLSLNLSGKGSCEEQWCVLLCKLIWCISCYTAVLLQAARTYNEDTFEVDVQDLVKVCVAHFQEICCPHYACMHDGLVNISESEVHCHICCL